MKKLILASVAVLGVNLAIAQTVNTQVGTTTTGTDPKLSAKIKADDNMRAERSATRMKQEFGLSDEQYTKLVELKKTKIAEAKAVNAKHVGTENADARMTEMKPVAESYKAELKKILTADQYTKWEENVNLRFERWKTAAYAQPNAPKPNEAEQRFRIEME